MLQVGAGKGGILRVSSGSDNSVNLAGNRWAPNAPLTNTMQKKSNMSELAHAEFGKIGMHSEKQKPCRKGQGGVVDWDPLVEPLVTLRQDSVELRASTRASPVSYIVKCLSACMSL